MEQDWEVLEFGFTGFEWDHEKAKSNRRKHGVGFEEAAQIFGSGILARHETHETEDRYVAIGLAEAKTLVVVFTQRRENIRIISARKATPSERRRHGAHFG
ncbi:MAG: BrnT family toxin [Hyphomicrobiales bacterium]|nr:BrnT family toxin [Hyphomicrobiales bacterium]